VSTYYPSIDEFIRIATIVDVNESDNIQN